MHHYRSSWGIPLVLVKRFVMLDERTQFDPRALQGVTVYYVPIPKVEALRYNREVPEVMHDGYDRAVSEWLFQHRAFGR
jgi:hypothetical protein